MDRAAIFRPSLISKKSRFSRMSLTSYNTFRKSLFVSSHFRYTQTFHASPGFSSSPRCVKNGTCSVPSNPSVWPGWPCTNRGVLARSCAQVWQHYYYLNIPRKVRALAPLLPVEALAGAQARSRTRVCERAQQHGRGGACENLQKRWHFAGLCELDCAVIWSYINFSLCLCVFVVTRPTAKAQTPHDPLLSPIKNSKKQKKSEGHYHDMTIVPFSICTPPAPPNFTTAGPE